MSDQEVWRVVPSAPWILASSHGRIMSFPFTGAMPNGSERHYEGSPTAGQWDGTRFIYTVKRKSYKVARLVCEAFNGSPPDGLNVCMHMDENSRNNRPENLCWGTQKENLNAPGFLAYCRGRTGEKNPRKKGRRAA